MSTTGLVVCLLLIIRLTNNANYKVSYKQAFTNEAFHNYTVCVFWFRVRIISRVLWNGFAGRSKTNDTPKQVIFSDGIRPGGDLTELDGPSEPRLPRRHGGRITKRVGTPPGRWSLSLFIAIANISCNFLLRFQAMRYNIDVC